MAARTYPKFTEVLSLDYNGDRHIFQQLKQLHSYFESEKELHRNLKPRLLLVCFWGAGEQGQKGIGYIRRGNLYKNESRVALTSCCSRVLVMTPRPKLPVPTPSCSGN